MYKGTIILLNRRLKSILGIIPSFENTEFDLSPGNVPINDLFSTTYCQGFIRSCHLLIIISDS